MGARSRRGRRGWLARALVVGALPLVLIACESGDDVDVATEPSGQEAATEDTADEVAQQRPESDFALAEEQREEFLTRQVGESELQSTGTIGSSTERIEDIESRYDASETEQQETQLTVPDHVLFDFDEDRLRAEAADVLDEVAEVIEHYAGAGVEVHGHTDDIGSASYNQDLSERRAAAVVAYLVDEAGVDESRLTARGFGQDEPVAANEHDDGSDDPEGRAANRRVEIIIDD